MFLRVPELKYRKYHMIRTLPGGISAAQATIHALLVKQPECCIYCISWLFRNLDLLTSDFPEFQESGCPEMRISGCPDIRIFEYPEIRIAEYPEIRIAEYPEIRIAECPGIQKSG